MKRDEAAKKGTLLHEVIEKYYNNEDVKEFPPEFKFFEEFIKKYPSIKPYRTEWRVFDSKHQLLEQLIWFMKNPLVSCLFSIGKDQPSLLMILVQ